MKIYGLTGAKDDGILTPTQQRKLDRRQGVCVKSVTDFWKAEGKSGFHPEIAMPTGFGKGRVVHQLLKHTRHEKILTVVGAKNILLDQSHDVLADLAIEDTGEADFSILPDLSGRVVLTTWQGLNSFKRRTKQKPRFGLAVVDEVHNIGTRKRLDILDWLNPDEVVGLTATAYRASGDYRSPEEYGFTVVDSMPLPECIKKRWLSPLMGVCIDTQVMLPKSVRNDGHLNQRKVAKALRRYPHLFRHIANDIAERFTVSGMKTVIVVNRVEEEACVIAEELMNRGLKVGLAVNQKATRELSAKFVTLDAIQRYKLPHNHPDAIQILISPQVIGEGFDAPATECVIWAAPTLSHVRYTQVIGRGSRRCWKKRYCLVVDYVYNIEEYGYSYNFAQFFRKEDLQELEGGFMYVGPEEIGSTIKLPSEFSKGGRIVPVVDLRRPVIPPANGWLSAVEVAQKLQRSFPSIYKILNRDFAHLSQIRINKGNAKPTPHWSPEILQILEKKIPEAGNWLSLNDLCEALGRSDSWVAKRLEAYEGETRLKCNRPTQCYPPKVLIGLRRAAEVPKAGSWLTVTQIAEEVGRSFRWTQARLKEDFPEQGQDRLDGSGIVRLHYPPRAVKKLRTHIDSVQSAVGWKNANEIAQIVERDRAWVEKRLRESFSPVGRIQLDRGGREVVHYPPSVVEILKQEAVAYPSAQGWLSINGLADGVGKDRGWVETRVGTHFKDQGEIRLNRSGRPCIHFPPSVLTKLKKMV